MSDAWRPYDRPGHDVLGQLLVHPPVEGPVPGRWRELYVWLPPSYGTYAGPPAPGAAPRRWPVVYFHDGHGLFDPVLKSEHDDPGIAAGDWKVDEALVALAAEGIEAIAVGIPNAGTDRLFEYTPWSVIDPDLAHERGLEQAVGERVPGQAEAYVDWVADVVKPLVDASFATLPGPEHTSLVGSSLGGIVSLVGYRRRPEIFGAAGVFSPAFWVLGEDGVTALAGADVPPGRVYVDIGGRESEDVDGLPSRYEREAREAARLLAATPGVDLRFVVDPHGIHHESAWAARLPAALRFLLSPRS